MKNQFKKNNFVSPIKYISFLYFLIFCKTIFSQVPTCPSNMVYMVAGSTIYNYNPAMPIVAGVNPSINTISLPGGASACLAVSNNLNGVGPSPTFYTVVGQVYYYYNGVSWVSTGHTTGGSIALNMGGSGNFIYNMDINSNLYVYNGLTNGSFLTVVNWAPGGPVDVIGDDCGNFYIMKTSTPQVMTIYNPSGTPIGTYTMTGMPNVSNGGGFAITGNQVFVKNSLGFYVGTISGNSINFVSSTDPVPLTVGDFGSCQFAPITMVATTIGSISCASPTASVVVTTTVTPVTYSWSGPGIVGASTSSLAIVNATGMYTCVITPTTGCASIVTTSVSPGTSAIIPTFTISNSLSCTSPTAQISITPNSGPLSYQWQGPGIVSGTSTPSIIANISGTYSVVITNTLTSCSGQGTTTLQTTPGTLTMTASNTSICIGTGATLTVTSNGATSYSWNPSSTLSQSTGTIVTATPTINTSYTISGSVGTCSATTISNVTVLPLPTVSVNPSNSSICIGGPGATFTASGANSYIWSPSSSLSGITGSVVTASPSTISVYTVTGSVNSCTNSTTFTVNIDPTLNINVNPPLSDICSGNSVVVNASGATSYTWSNSGGLNTTSGSVVSASPSVTTTYTVIGTSGVSGACSGSTTFTINVTPTPSLTVNASTTTICNGSSTNLFVSSADSYSWSPPTGLNSTTSGTVIANPNVSTTYSVIGTSSINPNCIATKTIHINVLPQTTGTINPNAEICIGKTTLLGAYGGNTFKWIPTSSLSHTNIGNPIASPSVTTTYTVFISNNGLCPDSQEVIVTVNPLPLVNAGNDTLITFGDSLLLLGNGQGVLEWISGDYLNCNHCSSAYVYPENTTCYELQATSNKGCKNLDVICVTVNKDYEIYIPNSFTPNNDGLNDVFYVSGFGIKTVELQVFDRWGAMIFSSSETVNGWDGKIKGQRVKNDVYVYKASITTITEKVVNRVGHVTLIGKQ